MPSRRILQACWNTLSPSWARCLFRRSPGRLPRSRLASVALRVSIGSRRKSWLSSSSRSKAYENTLSSEHRQAAPVAGDGLAVDDAGPRLEPQRGFQDRREAPGPVLPVPGQKQLTGPGGKATAGGKASARAKASAGAKASARAKATAGGKASARGKATARAKATAGGKANAGGKASVGGKGTAGGNGTAGVNVTAGVNGTGVNGTAGVNTT